MSKAAFLKAAIDRYPKISFWFLGIAFVFKSAALSYLVMLGIKLGDGYMFLGYLVAIAGACVFLWGIERIRILIYGDDYLERDFE